MKFYVPDLDTVTEFWDVMVREIGMVVELFRSPGEVMVIEPL